MNGAPLPHPQFVIERRRALESATVNLNQMLALHRAIFSVSAFYRFDVPLCPESQIVEAISHCESLRKQTMGDSTK